MKCQDYLDRSLFALDDGEVSADLAAHEEQCAACRRRGASMRAALDGIAALRTVTPPDFAKGAWTRVAAARAPWETVAPTLAERIAAWFALPQLAAAGIAVVLIAAVSMRSGTGTGAESATRVIHSTAGVKVAQAKVGIDVTVPEDGQAGMELGSATTVRVGGPAVLHARSAGLLELEEGDIDVLVRHHLLGPGGFRVVTPHLALRVTGTQFAVRTTREETVVEVTAGSVELESGGTTRMLLVSQRARVRDGKIDVTTPAQPSWRKPPSEVQPAAAPKPVERPVAPAPTGGAKPAVKPGERIDGQAVPVDAGGSVTDPFRSEGR